MAAEGQPAGAPVLEIDLPAPGPARAVPVPAGAASQQLVGPRAIVWGYSFRETTGTAVATLRLRNGASAGGALILSLALAAGGSAAQWTTGPGVLCDGGVYLEVVAGSVEGSVFVHSLRGR